MEYVIGIDGGGTKTAIALANEEGRIFQTERGAPSSWRNVGIENSAKNIYRLIEKIQGEKKVSVYYITLAAVEEEHKERKEEFISLLRKKGVKGEIVVESDQLAAFRTGTAKKNGIILIGGTGAVACGWRGRRKEKASGWGYLADEGSAFYVGIEGYRSLQKSMDGRAPKTKMQEIIFDEWGIKSGVELNNVIYSDFMRKVPMLSEVVGRAGDEDDKIAKEILREAAKELALTTKTVFYKLRFEESFPMVLSGGMFSSHILKKSVSRRIKKFAPKANIIVPKRKPVEGAVMLAIEYRKKWK